MPYVKENPRIKELAADTRHESFREAAYKVQLAQQQGVLDTFKTHFDVWFSERSLHEAGAVEHAVEKLRTQGHVFDSEGAIWLRTTDFGDDKDRVITKANGDLTYFASDTAYYINKRERGFDICIYMLGADHHGYVNRLRATAACAGDNPDYNVEILIGQLVKIMEGGEEVKLSKRAGTIITLEELVEKVGVDAARYTLIRYPVDTPMVMDIDILRRNTNENPVYYVQYAHARIAGVLRNVARARIFLQDFPTLIRASYLTIAKTSYLELWQSFLELLRQQQPSANHIALLDIWKSWLGFITASMLIAACCHWVMKRFLLFTRLEQTYVQPPSRSLPMDLICSV